MANEDLKRTLSLADAISVVAGSMIGCAIFIVTSQIAREVNNAWLVLLVWILAGIITIFGSLCYGELASGIPDEGGQYIYLKRIFNERIAFTYGITLLLIIQTGTIAAVSTAFAKFAGLIFPFISETNILFSIGGLEFSTVRLLAILLIAGITFINSRGINYGVITQNIFTITKILSLLLIIGIGLFLGANYEVIISNFHINFTGFSGLNGFSVIHLVATALVGALFASITWNNVTFIAGEVKEPQKNIPRAMIIGSGLVIALYILTNFIYLSSLNLVEIQNSMGDIVAAELTNKIFSQAGLNIIAVIIMISAFGCVNGMTLTGSRVYYKMAKDRFLFRSLAQINRHTRVPVNSLWFQCGWICLLILLGTYSKLLDFVIYSSLIFYIMTIVGMWFYRKKKDEYQPTFKVNDICVWGFTILCSIIVLCLSIYKPQSTLPGLLIILIGYMIYPMWKNKKK